MTDLRLINADTGELLAVRGDVTPEDKLWSVICDRTFRHSVLVLAPGREEAEEIAALIGDDDLTSRTNIELEDSAYIVTALRGGGAYLEKMRAAAAAPEKPQRDSVEEKTLHLKDAGITFVPSIGGDAPLRVLSATVQFDVNVLVRCFTEEQGFTDLEAFLCAHPEELLKLLAQPGTSFELEDRDSYRPSTEMREEVERAARGNGK